jgi:hypothetical protein
METVYEAGGAMIRDFTSTVEAIFGFMDGFIHGAVLNSPLWHGLRRSRFWSRFLKFCQRGPKLTALHLRYRTPIN